MALIKCNECNQEISDMATACPKCGFPVKVVTEDTPQKILAGVIAKIIKDSREMKISAWVYVIVSIIILCVVIYIISGFWLPKNLELSSLISDAHLIKNPTEKEEMLLLINAFKLIKQIVEWFAGFGLGFIGLMMLLISMSWFNRARTNRALIQKLNTVIEKI